MSVVIWLTGISGSGKSTIAEALSNAYRQRNIANEVLDGDIYRAILSPNDGYSVQERDEFRRKVIFIAELLVRNGVVCIVPLLSSSQNIRDFARSKFKNFIEVFIKCPIEICEIRDPKGLYKKVRTGELKDFVGVDLPYDEPLDPEITIRSDKLNISESVQQIIDLSVAMFPQTFSLK